MLVEVRVAAALVAGLHRGQVGVERRLRVDHHRPAAVQPDHQVGAYARWSSVAAVTCSAKSQCSSSPAASTMRRSWCSPHRPRTCGARSAATSCLVSVRSSPETARHGPHLLAQLGVGVDPVALQLGHPHARSGAASRAAAPPPGPPPPATARWPRRTAPASTAPAGPRRRGSACSVASSRAISSAGRDRAASQPSRSTQQPGRRPPRPASRSPRREACQNGYDKTRRGYRWDMEWIWLLSCSWFWSIGAVVWCARRGSAAGEQRELDDARAEAQRWYERLGGQVMNLHGDDPAVRQALADAGERYNAAGSQLRTGPDRSGSSSWPGRPRSRGWPTSGPPAPRWASTPARSCRRSPARPRRRAADQGARGRRAGSGTTRPARSPARTRPTTTRAGGCRAGRCRPAGIRSRVEDRRCAGAAGAIGGLLIMDALFSPAFADPGYGFDQGYQEGFQDGAARRLGDRAATPAATPAAATTAAAVTSAAATSAVATSSSSVGLAG